MGEISQKMQGGAICSASFSPQLRPDEELLKSYPGELAAVLSEAERIVVKIGTQIVCDVEDDGTVRFEASRLANLVEGLAELHKQGREIIVVTSGAVGLGREVCGRRGTLSTREKQEMAAVGQPELMSRYTELFRPFDVSVAQLLFSHEDFSTRKGYRDRRRVIDGLLEKRLIPIINENDPVSPAELIATEGRVFGDNDMMSALIACKTEADVLLILTNKDGVYTADPATNRDARLIPVIASPEDVDGICVSGQSSLGRGGMATKVEAAFVAAKDGVHCLIACGLKESVLQDVFINRLFTGTYIPAGICLVR